MPGMHADYFHAPEAWPAGGNCTCLFAQVSAWEGVKRGVVKRPLDCSLVADPIAEGVSWRRDGTLEWGEDLMGKSFESFSFPCSS